MHVGLGMLIPSDRLGLFATRLIQSILKTVFGINGLRGIEHLRAGEMESSAGLDWQALSVSLFQ